MSKVAGLGPTRTGRGTGEGETLDLERMFCEPGVQVYVKRNLALPRAGSR